MMLYFRFAAVLSLLVVLAGCEVPLVQQKHRVSAVISYFGESTNDTIQLPQSATAGVPFEVSVTTFGNGCQSAGGADVGVSGLTATVNVYDWSTERPDQLCTSELKRLTRKFTVQFDQPGTAIVRVQGRRVAIETRGFPGEPTVLEKTIVVR